MTGLADVAAGYGIKLCIEHFPGKALATVRDTLDYIAKLGHDNLYLLFDIGHAQISKEDPAEAVAGGRPVWDTSTSTITTACPTSTGPCATGCSPGTY